MSEARALDASAVRERLTGLRAAGAEGFDGPGLRFVEGLLRRAESLDGLAGERLVRRAAERLVELEDRLVGARAEARATLSALRAAGVVVPGAVRAAFERGDYQFVRLAAARAAQQARVGDDGAARDRVVRLAREARARGLAVPSELRGALDAVESGEAASAEDTGDVREVGHQLAQLLFRDTAEHARTAVLVARASDRLPAEVGPYNAQGLAAQALGLIDALSPAYLRAFLSGLEDQASLRTLPAPKRRRG